MDKERREKEIRLIELENKVLLPIDYYQYYEDGNFDNIDEKIRVLEQLEKGKAFESIPGAFDILEGYPKGKPGKDFVI